ncbi:phytanoyl-CoA dioxygenase family protein [Lysobacter brunescens]|uniref:Phytanoyl-CoA dioxygenase family protein n=1 Tax=Lysobacter brunescens TaxID=262323 RepID=A0ABW2YDE1_9GAMM
MTAAQLDVDGAIRLESGLSWDLLATLPVDDALEDGLAGARDLLWQPWCARLVAPIRRRLHAAGVLAAESVAVQCTLFRKTADCNWKVPYHQDLSVPVAARVEHPALTGWSSKPDGLYVQPPEALLSDLLAVRLHLDICGEDDGPLRIVPGSHRAGRLPFAAIADVPKSARERSCVAAPGDLWLMRPLVLHASSRALRPNGRRVLHFLFAPPDPGHGLQWRIAV